MQQMYFSRNVRPRGKKNTIIIIATVHEQYCLLVKTAQQKERN